MLCLGCFGVPLGCLVVFGGRWGPSTAQLKRGTIQSIASALMQPESQKLPLALNYHHIIIIIIKEVASADGSGSQIRLYAF